MPKAAADIIPDMVKQFQGLSAQKLLSSPALTGASALKDMLAVLLNSMQRSSSSSPSSTRPIAPISPRSGSPSLMRLARTRRTAFRSTESWLS
jgi:hypothetical protein